MGFLDRRERIVDAVLTHAGKAKLARGRLRFASYALFDDGVEYAPVLQGSGSMSVAEVSASRRAHAESAPMREPLTGRPESSTPLDAERINARWPLFTVRQGSRHAPALVLSPASASVVGVQRRGAAGSYAVESTSELDVAFGFDDGSFDAQAGFEVALLRSGTLSGGHVEPDAVPAGGGAVDLDGALRARVV